MKTTGDFLRLGITIVCIIVSFFPLYYFSTEYILPFLKTDSAHASLIDYTLDLALLVVGFLVTASIPYLLIYLLFLRTIRNTLQLIDASRRELSPNAVWLMLIPVFNQFWLFEMVKCVANSIRKEFVARGWVVEKNNFGRFYGMLGGGMSLVSTYLGAEIALISPYLIIPFLIGPVLCWLFYWRSIYRYYVLLRA